MRPQIAAFLILILIVVMGSSGSGCRSSTPTAQATTNGSVAGAPAAAAFVGRFSGQRAWKHLEALAAIGPRAVGTPGAAKAREYIESEIAALGLEAKPVSIELRFGSEDARTLLELVNLTATIPGNSSDLILLIAPYDSAYHEKFRFAGVNDGASGAAVLLELARVLVAKPLPYTARFIFLDGEAPLGRGTENEPASALLGSRSAAAGIERAGGSSKVRLLLHLNRVSDADLRIARDRFSHRIYRDAFWNAAARLGHRDVFPGDSSFEAPDSGHRAFFDRGMRRVVTIEDTRFGDGETQLARYTEDDTLDRSSEESLAIVGQVVLSGLRDISASLEQIDRFSEAPTIPPQDVPANERRDSAETPGAGAAPGPPPPGPEVPEATEPPPSPEAPEATEPPPAPEAPEVAEPPGEAPAT